MYFFDTPQNLFSYYSFDRNLDDEEISDIFQRVSNYKTIRGTTHNGKKNVRSSQIKWIPFENSTRDLYKFVTSIMQHANDQHFNFDIIGSQDDIQYTEYYSSELGKYGWHVDSLDFSTRPYRKLSLTIQLSDPKEYEGGDLEISIPNPVKNKIIKVPKEKGKIVVFPSYMWHRVTPVTKGTRKSLVWWVGGSQFR